MALNEIYRNYFQKSKIFLYPLLDIPRGVKALPTDTYLSWGDKYAAEDNKLVCLYNIVNDAEYKLAEAQYLLKHNRLVEYVKINPTTSVLIFDFSDLKEDWDLILKGKYSLIKDHLKQKILKYFNNNSANHVYIKSYLYPHFFMEDYARILEVPVELIQSVGQLCNKPDLEKERLLIGVEDLEKLKILD